MGQVPQRVEVEWLDAQGMPPWDDVDQLQVQARAVWDVSHYTAGYLIDDTPDYLAIASSWRPPTRYTAAQACDVMLIPTPNIVKRRNLRP